VKIQIPSNFSGRYMRLCGQGHERSSSESRRSTDEFQKGVKSDEILDLCQRDKESPKKCTFKVEDMDYYPRSIVLQYLPRYIREHNRDGKEMYERTLSACYRAHKRAHFENPHWQYNLNTSNIPKTLNKLFLFQTPKNTR